MPGSLEVAGVDKRVSEAVKYVHIRWEVLCSGEHYGAALHTLAAAKIMNVHLKTGIGGNDVLFFSVHRENEMFFTWTFHAASFILHTLCMIPVLLTSASCTHPSSTIKWLLWCPWSAGSFQKWHLCWHWNNLQSKASMQVIDEAAWQQPPALWTPPFLFT